MLAAVDSVDVYVLVDNYVDVLLGPRPGVAFRAELPYDALDREPLRAEHGSAFLVTVTRATSTSSVLYDAGLGRDTAVHNLDVLSTPVRDLRAIVLSHGHTDHHGGLLGLLRRTGRRGLPLVLHPDAWKDRELRFPDGSAVHLPPPTRNDLDREGVELLEEVEPTFLLDGAVMVSGQVERHTHFEPGMPNQFTRIAGGDWEPDPMVWDDQCLVVNVRDRGLVIISGCSHAGVVNILNHVRKLTGIQRIHGLIGGLHLSSPIMAAAIAPTVDAIVDMRPDVLVPGHCTGFPAAALLASRLPEAFITTSIGTRIHFGA
jgi:7,8-dihydropterin-6-yl-methyl-4-(beta-D-ribofuranosyl)aminobenzene 5'-phosphate synthase